MESDSYCLSPVLRPPPRRCSPRIALPALWLLACALWLCSSSACTPLCPTYSHSIALQPSRKKTNVNQRYKDWDERKYMGKKSKVRPK